MTVNVKFLRKWRNYKSGQVVTVLPNVAHMWERAGLIERVKPELECAAIEPITEQAVMPKAKKHAVYRRNNGANRAADNA